MYSASRSESGIYWGLVSIPMRQLFTVTSWLVDEVCVSLAPVLLGEGVPYFAKLDRGHVLFDDPVVVQGRRALHLRYPVRR